jgi:hypothetical protein
VPIHNTRISWPLVGTSWDGCFMFGSVPPTRVHLQFAWLVRSCISGLSASVRPHHDVVLAHSHRASVMATGSDRVPVSVCSQLHAPDALKSQTVKRKAGEAGPGRATTSRTTATGNSQPFGLRNGPAHSLLPGPRHRSHGLPHGLPRQKKKPSYPF